MMSRFFRNGDSSSSSSESDEASEDGSQHETSANGDQPREMTSNFTPAHTSNNSSLAITEASVDLGDNAGDFLLHSLLEERSLNQARASLGFRHHERDSPEVLAEARANYLHLCSRLSALSVIPRGLEHDRHSATRQRFRDGLDLLSRRNASHSTVPAPLRRLITDTEARMGATSNFQSATEQPRLPGFPRQLPMLLTEGSVDTSVSAGLQSLYQTQSLQPYISNSPNNALGNTVDSRYHRDFEEVCMLGRGGFGIVYQVRHRLDGQAYAVKKIPLSRTRIQKIQHRGQAELDAFLLELQTLARLEHPNIVRYYGGWIEWVNAQSPTSSMTTTTADAQATSGAQFESRGFSRGDGFSFNAPIEPDEADIVFENSGPIAESVTSNRSGEQSDHSENRLQRLESKSTVATVSDGTVETIDRLDEPSASIMSAADHPRFAESTFVLHVQMSLHPMTLADFISPPPEPSVDDARPLTHCFHLNPSIDILLAILDGIEYLHNEGIVHRDIKPANIFLGASTTSYSSRKGSINLTLCPDCQDRENSEPFILHVRIGDFGLVTSLAQDPSGEDSSAIGTEVYRPRMPVSNTSPSLDIYALGIIAFELMHKFDTRMERLQMLQHLKQGDFPISPLVNRLGRANAARAEECIRMMLFAEREAITIQQVREQLIASRA